MTKRAAKYYANNDAETGVSSFEPGQLIVLVYERIFDHLKLGKHSLEIGDLGVEAFSKAHDLIQQGLLACLDYQSGGDVAESLGAIYEWALREIINARLSKSPEKVQSVIEVLTPLYEAWVSLSPKEPYRSLTPINLSDAAAGAVNT